MFFRNSPVNISSSVPQTVVDYKSYLNVIRPNLFKISPISPAIVCKLVLEMKNTGSGGHAQIPPKVVKAVIDLIAETLSLLLNRCLELGYFPECLKIAQVIPVHKAGDKSKPDNYRPISILTVFSKILEKHITNELQNYFDINTLICREQWGFKKGVSTSIAIAKFLQNVYNGLNGGCLGVGVFLDLRKAFDTVDPLILLSKLESYGILGRELSLIRCFLSNRKQYVKIGDAVSPDVSMEVGTPQGSCLSPLLFKIFINDIVKSSNLVHFNLFADDTAIYIKGKCISELFTIVNRELDKIGNWILANKLALNLDKTVFLLFSGNKKVNVLPEVKIFGTVIQNKSLVKFLGLYIDDRLSWKPQIDYVMGKLSRTFGILSKIRNLLPISALCKIYNSLVYPHLTYGLVFWGRASSTNLNRIWIIQKKILRVVSKVDRYAHTHPIFKRLSILK